MLPGGKGRKGAPPLPHQGGQRQPPTVAQYESIIKHLQKANDTMAHEVRSGHMHALSRRYSSYTSTVDGVSDSYLWAIMMGLYREVVAL